MVRVHGQTTALSTWICVYVWDAPNDAPQIMPCTASTPRPIIAAPSCTSPIYPRCLGSSVGTSLALHSPIIHPGQCVDCIICSQSYSMKIIANLACRNDRFQPRLRTGATMNSMVVTVANQHQNILSHTMRCEYQTTSSYIQQNQSFPPTYNSHSDTKTTLDT